MRFCFLTLTVLLLFRVYGSFAQSAHSADRWIEKGEACLVQRKYDKAEKFFLKGIKAAPYSPKAYNVLGNFYSSRHQYEKAALLFKQAAGSCPKCADIFALPLAGSLMRAQQYTQAETVLSSWSGPGKAASQQEYDLLRRNIQFGKYATAHRDTMEPVNMGPRVNSEYDEYFPSISQDDSTLVFTRKTNGIDEDFYRSIRDSCGGWFLARALSEPPNSSDQEGAQMISADNHYLFFMRCGNRSPNGWECGGCDLYFSYSEKDGWSQPVPFGATINTPGFEGMPSLSPDNKVLYFVSDRAGGYGGKDIWMSRFEDGLWQIPENLGPGINTPGDETAPWIASDNKTLYFTSDGHPGLGGNDIYYTRKNESGQWEPPENLGCPVNSPYDDVSITISKNGKKAYFASNRPGGAGGMDIYEVPLPGRLQPEPQTFVYGIVRDSITGDRLPYAQLEWSDAETGKLLSRYQSNRGDASYLSAFPMHRKLALHVIRYNYLDDIDTLEFKRTFIAPPDTLNISLLPEHYQPPLTDKLLFRLYFPKNDASVSDSIKTEIIKQAAPYKNQPYVSFFINGFTDDSGTPATNDDISFARARLIGNILLDMGIDESKIHVQGWSDADPVVPNDSEENRQKNRRAELVVRLPGETPYP